MARPLTIYLLAYNCLQSLGWALALGRVLSSFVSDKTIHGAYVSAGDLICFLQTIAFVEVLHAAFGLVPSGAMLALMQWGGRTHFLLAIIRQIPEVQHLPSVFITFLAWSMSEAIRYPHYALSCIGISLSWLTYLRYTAFIVLYPIGLAPGEMWLMYQALPFIKERNLYAKFFSKLAISYYYFVLVVLIFYPFLWLKLYLHLLKQRRSKLGKHRKMKKV
ncbi:very-long-chain (3R)-3-hydroxyacyl-CoA dehydratase 2-like [Zingiber officinale]|uniref:very-long-chain (3R)-3-hydroxyacyl-CoA dehydratase 2-like n=1 Tax=Zingiber officinale TaxID=94328 RepID=UPI001C4BD930|nr:very-long-chain (3R)-3-hydroxyacyl-CoA dehydratase 2-like [Zingiber officinale]